MFRYYCHRAGVPLAKFVLPNPFGPREEPRFTAYLMKTWDARQSAQVKTPDYIRDNIHIDLLATIYSQFAEQVSAPGDGLRKLSPSCYAEKQGTFTRRVAEEVRERTGWPCGYELLPQTDFSEPMRRMNLDPAPPLVPQWNEKKAWDNFVEFYTRPKI
jgi:nucleoside-diphosphate-sugar epimerase